MPNIDLSILNQRQTPAFYADVFANRPAAGFVGRIFVSTDTYAFYRDNGTSWDLIGGPGTGTITGSGSSGSLALWNGTNTITYDVAITWNGTDNSISADKFIVNSGTSSQFLKGDGSLDSSAYVTTNIYNGNGTLSGERTVSLNGNNLIFDGGASIARVRMDADTNVARIFSFATNNLPRWAFRIDGTESGSNAGSDFAIRRYNDAGTFVDAPLTVTRSTGQSTFAKKVVIENNAGDQQLQIVSTTAPSLRIDNLQTGATKRIGLGLATAVNNFIQGSVDQDFCIFNSTTTASPILFGIYDAGLGNTQEAARISAARNFLVGTSVDAGYKLDVNGTSRFSQILYANANIVIGGASNTNELNIYATTSPTIKFQNSGADRGRILANSSALVYNSLTANGHDFQIDGVSKFNLAASTGAATFSNSVSVGDFLRLTKASTVDIQAYTGAAYTNLNYDAATHNWQTSGGTADMVLSATGNLILNKSTDSGAKLQVNGKVEITAPSSSTMQTVLGYKTAAASGSATTIAYVGYTNAIKVYLYVIQDTAHGSTAVGDITTYYGSSNGGITLQSNLGNVTNVAMNYNNAGYVLQVTVTYTGAAPTIYWTIEGLNNDGNIYAL